MMHLQQCSQSKSVYMTWCGEIFFIELLLLLLDDVNISLKSGRRHFRFQNFIKLGKSILKMNSTGKHWK